MIYPVLVCVAIGYLCGALPWGLWLGRWFRGVDVRTLGSGNLGATNVYRSLGPVLGIATLLLDMLKGALPVWIVAQRLPSQGRARAWSFALLLAGVATSGIATVWSLSLRDAVFNLSLYTWGALLLLCVVAFAPRNPGLLKA